MEKEIGEEIKEGRIVFKDSLTKETKEGILSKDEKFWGGYKIEFDGCISSIHLVENIEYIEK